MKFYIRENNSGGVLKLDHRYICVEADTLDLAISKFEDHFNLDWRYENDFEGGSCSCCGCRFEIYSPGADLESNSYDEESYDYLPYFHDHEDLYTIPS